MQAQVSFEKDILNGLIKSIVFAPVAAKSDPRSRSGIRGSGPQLANTVGPGDLVRNGGIPMVEQPRGLGRS